MNGIFSFVGDWESEACSGAACGTDVLGDADVAVDKPAAGGTVSQSGDGTADVVAAVVGGVVLVVGAAVVVGVVHGSTDDVGVSSVGAASGAALGVVVVGGADMGCAMAPAVPVSNTRATVPAANSDLDTDRVRQRGGRRGLAETVVMVIPSFKKMQDPIELRTESFSHPRDSQELTEAPRAPKQTTRSFKSSSLNRAQGLLVVSGKCTDQVP